MEIKVKLWHIISAFAVIAALVWMTIASWTQGNTATIDGLNYEIKQGKILYKQQQVRLDSFVYLATQEHERAEDAEKNGREKDSIIAALTLQRKGLVKKLSDEKTRISNLDSVGQYSLLRSNITKLLNAK